MIGQINVKDHSSHYFPLFFIFVLVKWKSKYFFHLSFVLLKIDKFIIKNVQINHSIAKFTEQLKFFFINKEAEHQFFCHVFKTRDFVMQPWKVHVSYVKILKLCFNSVTPCVLWLCSTPFTCECNFSA